MKLTSDQIEEIEDRRDGISEHLSAIEDILNPRRDASAPVPAWISRIRTALKYSGYEYSDDDDT